MMKFATGYIATIFNEAREIIDMYGVFPSMSEAQSFIDAHISDEPSTHKFGHTGNSFIHLWDGNATYSERQFISDDDDDNNIYIVTICALDSPSPYGYWAEQHPINLDKVVNDG